MKILVNKFLNKQSTLFKLEATFLPKEKSTLSWIKVKINKNKQQKLKFNNWMKCTIQASTSKVPQKIDKKTRHKNKDKKEC